ncbi:MAG: ATP-binding protein, partial [Anaeroplasmataceae bacterium]|nr:ATP-binding protein [Anaeroplasmataceae bacterium]
MESVIFQVSAKTARLIGRENISDVDGAIIELVKNGYDADAECVYVKYIQPYNEIPTTITFAEFREFFSGQKEMLENNYEVIEGKYILKEKRTDEDIESLESYIHSLCKIIVLDNGCGMSQNVLKTSWMNIGTDDKEINIVSKKKLRVKTGAKGIGRFALDKLSLKSKVITKCSEEKAIQWQIDWTQFDNAKLLNQVHANIDIISETFEEVVKLYTGNDYKLLKEYDWTTGTLIELSPIRDFWDERLYQKVNRNLTNINPLGSVDKFDIIVENKYYSQYNFQSISEGINREDYDYLIEAEFDGNGNVNIVFDRNEIDIQKEKVKLVFSKSDIEIYNLQEFWDRENFHRKGYTREDFRGINRFRYNLKEILGGEKVDYKKYNSVGTFKLKLYYLKNQKSTVEIIRDFRSRERKKLTNIFSGIKIYRDNFKVRPYGDDGQFYDWINLSERVQKSPAAASHEFGNWRVSPNQLIGSVSISRINNPKLADNANREGMSLNREYDYFVDIIQGVINKFEYDRQYPLREYAIWYNSKKKAHNDKVQQIYEQVIREREQERKRKNDTEDKGEEQYTREDLKDAVYLLGKEKNEEASTEQLMMVLSAAGVMAQTFSHEITRIATNLGSRGQHLREAVNRMLNYQPFSGDEDFNPYDMIEELDSTDELLSEWVSLIMDSIQQEKFDTKSVTLSV